MHKIHYYKICHFAENATQKHYMALFGYI